MSLSPIYSVVPDCTTQIILFSESAPICARVCKHWRQIAEAVYPFVLDVYTREIPHFVPKDRSPAPQAVQQTYLAVMKNKGTHIRAVRVAMACLDRSMPLAMPLVLGPVVKLVEDENRCWFFRTIILGYPHEGTEKPLLEGSLAEEVAIMQNWTENHQDSLNEMVELDFFNCNLTILPPEIGQFRNLQCLSLGYNNLAALPPEIFNLTNLTTLNLTNNQITTLPAEIGNLTSLKCLNLHDNPLSTLPKEISQLSNLQQFYLNYIRLKDLHQRPPLKAGLITDLCALGRILGALRKGYTPEALEVFKGLSTDTKTEIYAELYKILPFQNKECAEHAFLQINGRDIGDRKRIMIVENFLNK